MAEVTKGEVKGIDCIKDYGMITFVSGPRGANCPISGTYNCVECDVITANEAKADKQVKEKGAN